MTRRKNRLLISVWLTLAVPSSFSQNQTSQTPDANIIPAGVIMPWETVGIDSAVRTQLKDTFAQVRDALTEKYLSSNRSLTAFALASKKKPLLTLNLQRRSDDIIVGDLKISAPSPIIIEPVLCSLADYYLFFITIKDLAENTIASSGHTAIKKTDVIVGKKSQVNAQIVTTAIDQAGTRAFQRLSAGIADKKTALKIGFSNGFENTRIDIGSSQCMNLLLAENLAPRYRIVANIGNESIGTLQRMISPDTRMQRTTRQIINYWTVKNPERQLHQTLPMTVQVKSTAAEAVFANQIPVSFDHSYDLGPVTGGEVPIVIDPSLESFLSNEKVALATTDWPKISKIYKAWVYLDRGRAWGLKIDDRLVIEGGGSTIKGHVVGYFGPEQSIKSPDGKPIYEGAIVFVRKGQNDVKIGQTFKFDQTAYPTPWPPASVPRTAK
jgi:hypothetical protein